MSFLGGSDGKESTCNAGDLGSFPGLGRSPGEENGNPIQYSCLENPQEQRSVRGLQSMGLQGVRHDWLTFTFTVLSLIPQIVKLLIWELYSF